MREIKNHKKYVCGIATIYNSNQRDSKGLNGVENPVRRRKETRETIQKFKEKRLRSESGWNKYEQGE